ncbi:MAG: type I restriction-modification enzyme R subunit C-terminal domain-containing protein, partial [Candidatus Moraniibacteriota bacterium]
FRDEEELRTIWSVPDTREKLLAALAEEGFGKEQLAEMQKIIDAEKSDLFDVLAYIAYAKPPVSREERSSNARSAIQAEFNDRQKAFLDFVLSHYVQVGIEELGQDKLTPLLRLKYDNSIADALSDLGTPREIGQMFIGFQPYLYAQEKRERQRVA